MGLTQAFLLALAIHLASSKSGSETCSKVEVSLTQKIENEGFHRTLRWLLEAPNSQCKLALQFNVGKEVYVNPDEISELSRKDPNFSALVVGKVDIEAPANSATAHMVYLFVPEGSEEGRVSLELPFHLRYQRAQISGGFGKVMLSKPSVLALCPNAVCGSNEIKAPCGANSEEVCAWKNVTYEALFDEMELLVPVGDLDDYPLVSIVTLLLGCAGCIYTLSVLSTTPL